MQDAEHMRAALALAQRGLGSSWPNPSVGCVIVRDGTVVGRGATRPGGRPHAEAVALEMAGEGPVMKPEPPWEGKSLIFRNSIIYDGQEKLFKFWYGCFDPNLPPITPDAPVGSRRRWAYATSSDGMRWERPELGLVDFQGSRKNNLISVGDVGETVGMLHSVVRDDRDRNRLRRYKSIGIDRHRVRSGELSITHPGEEQFDRDIAPKLGVGLFMAYSADGVRWTMR